jgi:transposase
VDDLRKASIESEHPRTRERFLALYLIASGQFNATSYAKHAGRSDETVLSWIHNYNEFGPQGLLYKSSGGRRPFLSSAQAAEILQAVDTTQPVDHALPGHLWTVKKLRHLIHSSFGQVLSPSMIRRILKDHGYSWKKIKKFLGKANAKKRAEYVRLLLSLLEKMLDGEIILVWVDEVHVHREMDLGYTWSKIGQRVWRESDCPGLSDRLNFYGGYDYTHGECFLWQNGNCNAENTIAFLQAVKEWRKDKKGKIVIIWHNSSVHTAKKVKQEAERLGIELVFLPAYSPDLNPIERLWLWMRQEVTKGYCHESVAALEFACLKFICEINQTAEYVIQRLAPKFELDPEYEKLLV